MKKLHIFIVTGIFMGISLFCFAEVNETLPTHHWAYNYIDALQDRGYLLELNTLQLPYTRGEIARQLVKEESGKENWSLFVKEIFHELLAEFSQEINVLNSEQDKESLLLRGKYEGYIDNTQEDKTVYRGIYRGGIGAQVGKHVFAYSGFNFDQYDYHDPLYTGYKWRGLAGYTEQAYVRFKMHHFDIVFGRDFLQWGAGQSGTLIMSNITRPLDQLRARVSFGPFDYMFIASELNRMSGLDSNDVSITVRRYLSGHRLGVSFFNGRLRVAVSELIIYGGQDEYFNTVYLNPVIFYHGAKKNGAGNNNVLPTIDIKGYPKKNIQIYGSLLLDDIQVEKTVPGDLEPNEIGVIIGTKWSDPFELNGLTVSGEYVKITNRTYKTPHFEEVFLHRNQSLGHPLGNDFDLIQAGVSKWFGADLWVGVQYEHVRKGEGSLYAPWDAPWKDKTLKEGYSEPFPTGVVEKRDHIRLEFRYQPGIHWGIQGEVVSSSYGNYQHVAGAEESFFEWRVGVWWDGEVFLMW